MKIAFASEGNNLKSKLSEHFSKSNYFIFVDSETEDITKIIANPYKLSHNPGEIPEFIKQEKADILISGGIGKRAISYFNKLGIKVLTYKIKSINEVLKDYLNSKVKSVESCKKR